MNSGLQPKQATTCMKCRKSPSRYHGKWGGEGLCRPCLLHMSPEVRRKVLRDMFPEDRKMFQLDNLWENAPKK